MTKGELLKKLQYMPDDVEIYITVEYGKDGKNWDTREIDVSADMYLCEGKHLPGARCTHTNPEIDYEVIFYIRQYKYEDTIEIT